MVCKYHLNFAYAICGTLEFCLCFLCVYICECSSAQLRVVTVPVEYKYDTLILHVFLFVCFLYAKVGRYSPF